MTLHEAIRKILLDENNSLSATEIAERINAGNLYQRNDNKPVTSSQITARVNNYSHLFHINEDSTISLLNPGIIVLKDFVRRLINILQRHYPAHQVEILTPSFVLALWHKDFITEKSSYFIETDQYQSVVFDVINALNQSSQYDGIFNRILDLIRDMPPHVARGVYEDWLSFSVSLIKTKLSKEEFGSFFSELINEFQWKERFFRGHSSTPPSLITLIKKLVKLKEGEVVFDPYVGRGSLITEIIKENKHININVVTGDTNEAAVYLARLNFIVNGINRFEVHHKNALRDWEDRKAFADWFITDAPFGGVHTEVNPVYNRLEESPAYDRLLNTKDVAPLVVMQALYHLKANGKAVLILPESFIFGKSQALVSVRRYLVENNILKAIISLPTGAFQPYSSVKTSIIILDKHKGNDKSVFYHDASSTNPKELDREVLRIERNYHNENFTQSQTSRKVDISELIYLDYGFDIRMAFQPNYPKENGNYLQVKEVIKSFSSGNTVRATNLNEAEGVGYLQIGDLADSMNSCIVDDSSAKRFISDPELVEGTLRYIPYDAVLIAKNGLKLKPSLFKGVESVCSSNILVLQLDDTRILPEYFIAEMNEPYVADQVSLIRKGMGVPNFNTMDFLKIKIRIPALEEQKKIADKFLRRLFSANSSKKEIHFLTGELMHKLKGPVSGLDNGIKLLKAYLERKEKSGEAISFKEVIVKTFPGEDINKFQEFVLAEVFDRLASNIKRIDNRVRQTHIYAKLGVEDLSIEEINLFNLLKKEILPGYNHKLQIILDVKAEAQNMIVLANKDLMEVIFENLIDNAIIHGFKDNPNYESIINIRWKEDIKNKLAIVTVENNGEPLRPGYSTANYKDGTNRNEENGGSGIGGVLIAKALKQMKGELVDVIDASKKFDVFKTKVVFSIPLKK